MGRLIRRAILFLTGVAFLATPLAAREPALGHDCEAPGQVSQPGAHPAPAGLHHSAPCQDCSAPACHTSDQCSGAPAGLPGIQPGSLPAARGRCLPFTIEPQLRSIIASPPTRPPLRLG